jgi:3-methylcrotonyl-CoA carboxylase alpha subunit
MQVGGPPTNIDFLQKLTKHPAFVAAEVDTGFIERHAEDLLAVNPVSTRGVAVAARLLLMRDEAESQAAKLGGPQLASPWTACDGYRLGHQHTQHMVMGVQRGTVVQVHVHPRCV